VWVDFTSGVPDEAIQIHDLMAEAGVRYLDAGVAGGPGGADQAKLSMMIGGCEETLTRMQPLLRLMSAPGKVVKLFKCVPT
jgi:3-hydroxyisobutyrate dehydrogenase